MAKLICNFISYTLKRAVDITVVLPSVTFPEACGDGNVKGVIPKHTKEEKYLDKNIRCCICCTGWGMTMEPGMHIQTSNCMRRSAISRWS